MLTRTCHCLSRVGAYPPDKANTMALLGVELAFDALESNAGITFGGDGPSAEDGFTISPEGTLPSMLAGIGDATWGATPKDVYGYIVAYNRGPLAHGMKSISVVTDSSMAAEGVASSKVSAMLMTACEQLKAHGMRPSMPLTICTDSVSNLQVTVNAAAANRSTHQLRRWHVLRQLVKEGKVDMYHLGDESMLADFFTKFVDKAKAEWSIKVITNANNAVSAAKTGAT